MWSACSIPPTSVAPTQLFDQVSDSCFFGGILTTIHHRRVDFVIRIGIVLDILVPMGVEGFHHPGLGEKFLEHFQGGLGAVQTVGKVGADWIGAINQDLALEFFCHGYE